MYYVYDGSFDGFLCCVHAHYYRGPAEGIRSLYSDEQMLLFQEQWIETDFEISHRVFSGLQRKLGKEICDRIFRTFLSDRSDKDMILLRYIACCLKFGKDMDSYHTHPEVLAIHQISERVGREAHHFLGWLRFSEIQGVLYAAYEPEGDLTCVIMPHFADRLRNERFIIHDLRRQKAGIYANGYWEERHFTKDLRMYKTTGERVTEDAWQAYFDHIAITERENRQLQQKFMPIKIWKNLTEKVIKTS